MRIDEKGISEIKPKLLAEMSRYVHLINDGKESEIKLQPFYERRDLITDDIISKVLHDWEYECFQFELDRYRSTHNNWQGIQPGETLIRPKFDEMPPAAQRALVEFFDALCQPWRIDDGGAAPTPPPDVAQRIQELGY